jgi:tetratricopeptide (TPR) repeat protein
MRWSTQVAVGFILCGLALAGTITAKTDSIPPSFAQMVIPFAGERPFTYEWLKADNALVLNFPKSHPDELEAITNYDERLVRRVIIRDLGPQGSEVKMILRNQDVRAVVSTFKDPFRVTIDLFDKTYTERKDPESGLPLSAPNQSSAPVSELQEPKVKASAKQPPTRELAHSDTAATPRRKLMQASTVEITTTNELKSVISKIDPGIGKAWATYPPYIYRMQLAPYEGREAPASEISNLQAKAMTTSSAMADYASKLFDFGHEGRALAAYQQVLQKEPGVFEKDAIHLWKFAETHLGQGNITLADGYYQTLIEKHPDHMMARFARLRKIDTQAIKALQAGEPGHLASLAEKAGVIPTRDNSELLSMIAIRNTWWNDTSLDQTSRKALPSCPEETQVLLTKLLPKVENPRTAYIASALIAQRITSQNTPWQNDYALWLSNFFKRYKGSNADGQREALSLAAKQRITKQFSDLFSENQYVEVVTLYSQLPQEMKSISKDPTVSWQIAESYRTLGQQDKAIEFYKKSMQTNGMVDLFKSSFWLGALASKRESELRAGAGNQATIRSLAADSSRADKTMDETWAKLKSDEKSLIMTALNRPIQDIVASDAKLRTPPKILLEQYKSALSKNAPKMNATTGTAVTDWAGNFSPSASTVRLLDDLGRKFAELGMTSERRQAMELMKFLKPSQFEQDKEAAKLWEAELTKLAEEHRKADEFLEAGELYTLVGDSTLQTEKRAESLYKGGLLLFRAGKKQEAISALEKAKSDSSNLFYSKLATERLNQIDTK